MGLRQWVSRPLRGRRIGVENLLRGGEGIPVSLSSRLLSHLVHILTMTIGSKATEMDSSNNRPSAFPDLGRCRRRHRFPDRFFRTIRTQRRNTHVRLRLLAKWKPGCSSLCAGVRQDCNDVRHTRRHYVGSDRLWLRCRHSRSAEDVWSGTGHHHCRHYVLVDEFERREEQHECCRMAHHVASYHGLVEPHAVCDIINANFQKGIGIGADYPLSAVCLILTAIVYRKG
jgi:hypothetical protein